MKATFELTDNAAEEARLAEVLAERGLTADDLDDLCRRETRHALGLTPEQRTAAHKQMITARLDKLTESDLEEAVQFVAGKADAVEAAAVIEARP